MTIDTDTTTNSGTGADDSSTNGNGRLSGASDRVRETTRRAGEALGTARTRASEAYAAARERTSSVYGSARQTASRAGQRTAQGVDSYPEAAILGGLALGAVVAALLPKTQRETQALGQVGRRINDTAREAVRAAKEAGQSRLQEAGLTPEGARQTLSDIASKASDVAKTSASAAAQRVKGSQD